MAHPYSISLNIHCTSTTTTTKTAIPSHFSPIASPPLFSLSSSADWILYGRLVWFFFKVIYFANCNVRTIAG